VVRGKNEGVFRNPEEEEEKVRKRLPLLSNRKEERFRRAQKNAEECKCSISRGEGERSGEGLSGSDSEPVVALKKGGETP